MYLISTYTRIYTHIINAFRTYLYTRGMIRHSYGDVYVNLSLRAVTGMYARTPLWFLYVQLHIYVNNCPLIM